MSLLLVGFVRSLVVNAYSGSGSQLSAVSNMLLMFCWGNHVVEEGVATMDNLRNHQITQDLILLLQQHAITMKWRD